MVGNSWTYADVDIFFTLRHFFQMVFNEHFRTHVFPNVTRWFTEISNNEHVLKVCGRTQLCKVVQKAPKLGKDPHAAKHEKKKEEPKKKEEKNEEEPPKKPKNPLDELPESKFVLDDWKREFMNSKDRVATMKDFWGKFDPEGFSFYWLQYQNLPSEGKVLFKTNNSVSMFLQKLDHFRKYCFAVYGVYGVENDYKCRGVFMWRGKGIPQEVIFTIKP